MNDLSDEELEELEKKKAEDKPDFLDFLEELRVLLNKSKVEQIHYFHTHSEKGRECSYYKKSKQIFDREEKADVLILLTKLSTLLEYPEEIKQ